MIVLCNPRMPTSSQFSRCVSDHKTAASLRTVGSENDREPVAWRNHVAGRVLSAERAQLFARHAVCDSDVVFTTLALFANVKALKV